MEENKNLLDFNTLIEEIKGKNIQEIKETINQNKDFWKEVSNIEIFSEIDILLDNIDGIQKEITSIFSYLKKEMIFFKALELFTNVFALPYEGGLNNYNIYLEMALKEENIKVMMFYELVEEGLKERKEKVLNELYNIFKTKIPTIDELKEMETELQGLFSEESPEKLKLIDSILAYNDPSIKQLKDIISTESIVANKDKNILDNK